MNSLSLDQEILLALYCRNIDQLTKEEAIAQLCLSYRTSLDEDAEGVAKIGKIWGITDGEKPELSIEKQFAIESFNARAKNCSLEQARDLLKELYRQRLIKENLRESLLTGFSNETT